MRDKKGFERLAEIVSLEEETVFVTVSASYGVTEFLIETLNTELDSLNVRKVISHLRELHDKFIEVSIEEINGFEVELDKLERLLYGIAYTEEITPRSYDLILSFGERLVSHIVKHHLDKVDRSIRIVDPAELIITNGVFRTSTVLLDETENKCNQYRESNPLANEVVIVPGYSGVSEDNIVNLLGRSGTDYTATALAYGFNLDEVIIWKDVLGFMTADPNIIDTAKTLEKLSYEEAAELSHFGAQILHSRSVIPAKLKRIPIRIRHQYDDDIQTLILDKEETKGNEIVKSVSYLQDLTILRIYTTLGSNIDGVFNKISDKLVEASTNIISIATSQTCISVLINNENTSVSLKNLEQLKPHIIDDVEVDSNIALIGIVGSGLGDTPGIASKVFNSIAKINVNVEMISSGASKAAYHFTVKQRDLKSALLIIHEDFFGK